MNVRSTETATSNVETTLRELELELDQARSQAEAARHDARVAELELQIQRLRAHAGHKLTVSSWSPQIARPICQTHDDQGNDATDERPLFESWQEVMSAMSPSTKYPSASGSLAVGVDEQRTDLAARLVPRKRPVKIARHQRSPDSDASLTKPAATQPPTDNTGKKRSRYLPQIKIADAQGSPELTKSTVPIPNRAVEVRDVEVAEEEPKPTPSKRKPAAWVCSAVIHAAILLLLGLLTISTHKPGDQVALSGSVADTDELAVETIEIQTEPMEVAQSDPTPSEVAVAEVSDFGELMVTDVKLDVTSPANLISDAMLKSTSTSASSMSLKSDSESKIKFCGVEGGGNHFVYLVDSSGSMGDAFPSARRELLQSIGALKSDQRFYVIFFDENPDYMRLSSISENEPRSVFATPANRDALQSWAMSIKMDRGKAPYDALPFAIDLQPDAIFLLSDGEFPQRIEEMLTKINRQDNLFGDDGPLCRIHTIGYHSREGESRMKRIAKQNGGQYRHVPKP